MNPSRFVKSIISLVVLAGALSSIAADYQHPVAVIPYAATKPLIDGKVNGTILTVPVERHNYRLLVMEAK